MFKSQTQKINDRLYKAVERKDLQKFKDALEDGMLLTTKTRAEYFGTLSNNSAFDQQFGIPGVSLPVSGSYGGSGTYINGLFNPNTATWALALPQPGGFVTQFGAPNVDVPVPAAYNGGGIALIATFRPRLLNGGDADSFNVDSSSGLQVVRPRPMSS